MVENIDHFEYIITDSELEALVLECNLIKEHRPKYNTMMKDDKSYPLKYFASLEDIKKATEEELRAVEGMNEGAARAVWEFFREKECINGKIKCQYK